MTKEPVASMWALTLSSGQGRPGEVSGFHQHLEASKEHDMDVSEAAVSTLPTLKDALVSLFLQH